MNHIHQIHAGTTTAITTEKPGNRRTKRLVAATLGAVVAAGLLASCGVAASREGGQAATTTSTAAPPTSVQDRPTSDRRSDDDRDDPTDAGGKSGRPDETGGDQRDRRDDDSSRTKRTTTTTAADDRAGGTITKAEYTKQANAVCRSAHDELAALGSAPEGDPDAANAYAAKGVDIVQRQLDGLKAIPKPKGDEAELDELLGHVQGIVAAYREGFEAGKAGDQAKVTSAHSRAVSEARAADRIASAYGLDVCAE